MVSAEIGQVGTQFDGLGRPYEVHQFNLTWNGIYHHENLKLDEPAADQVYEFPYVFSPLRLKGANRSPGNPISVR